MQIVLNVNRSTALKTAVATGLALALAGAIGSAIAMSPIITPPIKWAGGAEFGQENVFGGPFPLYSVPAGRNFILTDLILGNTTDNAVTVNVHSGAGGACASTVQRLHAVVVPANGATTVALQTGIGFTSGQAVCVTTAGFANVDGRGFLFTAAPP